MVERRCKESTMTFKTWGIIVLIGLILGFFFLTAMAHENRLTKVETTLEVNLINIAKSIDKLTDKIDHDGRVRD